MYGVNLWAVLGSAVASMVIGSIWYGPLFGKMFIRAMGMDQMPQAERDAMKKAMIASYVWQFVASLVTFFVLAKFIGDLDQLTVSGGICIALWVWFGFIVPMKLGEALWGGKMTVFWLGVGNMLLTMVAAGAIIGALA